MQNKKLSVDDVSVLILIFAFIFGTFWRLFPVWLADFPLNDGGMFYTMIQDLQNNQYRIPAFTTYNNSNIPFVYPPLGFYFGAMLTDLFGLSTPLLIIQWLPGILNSISILAFYFFAKEITQNKFQSAIATFVFSFTPHMTSWFSMGGGLTRSLGAIFMLFALVYVHRVFSNNSKKDLIGAIIFSGLTTLSHPESAMYTVILAVYIWFVKSRSLKGILYSLLIASGTSLLISPWLISVIKAHGFAPFISASQTGLHSFASFFRILNIDFVTEETYLDLFGVAGVLGIALLVSRKNFFIPGMFLVTFLFLPRSAHTLANIPLAIAVSFFIMQILMLGIKNYKMTPDNKNINLQYKTSLFILIIIPFVLGNSIYYSITLSTKHVSEDNRTAMQWIRENTPLQSNFFVITGETNGFCDSASEWFPALTNRKSFATLQGNEWLQGNTFNEFIANSQSIQACYQKDIDCIMDVSRNFTESFDYIYIDLIPATNDCNLAKTSIQSQTWMHNLEKFPQFQIVFISNQAMILKHE
ncbi:MAG TPA: hypothetical protein DHW49_13030 [Anaerolineae bacterium]|nr:hypothetical protein [Anaerolineae bacterium]